MLVEPPGADLPAGPELTDRAPTLAASPGPTLRRLAAAPSPSVRLGALVATAAILPLAAVGPLAVAALAVAASLGHRRAALAVVLGSAAAGMRWGTGSLEAVVGVQEVLGPALTLGPASAAASTALAAAAVVLAAADGPRGRAGALRVLPAGLLAAAFVAGGARDLDLVVRLAGAVSGALASLAVWRLAAGRAGPVLGWLAVGCGLAAVGAALA